MKARKSPEHAQAALPPDLVPHPRYGAAVVPSGEVVTEAEVRGSFWQYAKETLFPASAIRADLSRQNFSTMARGYYVDLLRRCRDCDRPYLFFAREQRHWYEVLGFYVDADCVRCPGCRRGERAHRQRFRRFANAVTREDLRAAELATLAADAAALWEDGVLRDEQKLRRICNRVREALPGHRATRQLERLIAAL